MKAVKQFEINKTYKTRSICDHECVFSFTVIKRTAKRITLKNDGNGKIVTKGIYIYDGSECCKPEGNYSMAPTIKAIK